MRRSSILVVTALLAVCSSCAAKKPTDPAVIAARQSLEVDPPLRRAVKTYDMESGKEIDVWGFIGLSLADVVFLGETHTDETTHRYQLGILSYLDQARRGGVVLAMEQFERDAQKPLDDYLAGTIDEKTFKSRVPGLWSNYDADYRPLIEYAKARHIPVVASNAASAVRRKLASGGRKAFDALTEEERGYVAREMLPETDAYWKRVDDATRGHAAMGMAGPATPEEMLFNGQSVWDNTMAESIALAHERWPDRAVVHVNGGFHSAYFDGTVAQLKKRAPDLVVKTIAIESVDDIALATVPTDKTYASFVVHAANIAQSEHDDLYTVRVARDVKYRFSKPDGVTKPPLLIFLPGRGTSAAEVESLLKASFGAEAAIAVVEPTHPLPPGTSDDLGESGAFFASSFEDDLSVGGSGARSATEYLLRRFDLDSQHVVVAGSGDGARLAIACGLDGDFALSSAIAIDPGSPGRIGELSPSHAIPKRSLEVLCDAKQIEAWNGESKRLSDSGVASAATSFTADPWRRSGDAEGSLRAALGLPEKPPAAERKHIVLEVDTPRSRLWAERYARKAAPGAQVAILTQAEASAHGEDIGTSTALDVAIHAAAFKEAHALPTAPGSFGGTTIVVVPAAADAAERDAWIALESDDPINKASRFSRLRVATPDGDHALSAVLDKLKTEGRKNVLLVPAVFCADGDTMRALKASVADRAGDFTFAYSPGLGGRLPAQKP